MQGMGGGQDSDTLGTASAFQVPFHTWVPRSSERAPSPRATRGPWAYSYFPVLGGALFLMSEVPL